MLTGQGQYQWTPSASVSNVDANINAAGTNVHLSSTPSPAARPAPTPAPAEILNAPRPALPERQNEREKVLWTDQGFVIHNDKTNERRFCDLHFSPQ